MSDKIIVATEDEIIKTNALIEASYKLSNQEQKLIYLAAKKLQQFIVPKEFTEEQRAEYIFKHQFDLIEFTVLDFKNEYNLKAASIYNEMEITCNRLYERSITFMEDGKPVKKRWVITSKYDQENHKISLKFHPDLTYDLIAFNNKYTIFKFSQIKGMKSNYSFRIYELMEQYKNIDCSKVINLELYSKGTWAREFTIKDLRFKLGIEPLEYPEYGNLKQKVINVAIKEINKFTNIDIEIKEIKERRKTMSVIFIAKLKPIDKKENVLIDSDGNLYDQLAAPIDEVENINAIDPEKSKDILQAIKDRDKTYNE